MAFISKNHPSATWVMVLGQAAFSSCAVVLGIWIGFPSLLVVTLGILSAEIISISRKQSLSKRGLVLPWICTLAGLGWILFATGGIWNLSLFYVTLGCLNSFSLLVASFRVTELAMRKRVRLLAMTWGFGAGIICVASAYSQNRSGVFPFGLLINVVLLGLCKSFFKLPTFLIQTINTLILLSICFPLVDFAVRPRFRAEPDPDPHKQLYLYDRVKSNPGGQAAWQAAYEPQMRRFGRHIFIWHPFGTDPLIELKPNASAYLFQSLISINSKGFRGKEFNEDKRDTYRIVALGESTTFGLTLCAEEKPWPEMLEQMIRERIKSPRPVEIINAGVPCYDLKNNLDRMARQILPLKPDMIISYHGYNGFPLINSALPDSLVTDMPAYYERPLKLLADCEYKMKLLLHRRRDVSKATHESASAVNPMDTRYAALYRELIEISRTNQIQLVLANYAMAVNTRSEPRLIEFYRTPFPLVYWQIKANETHSAIVSNLAQAHPEVGFVDICSRLDGKDHNFIDLMHFSPEGSTNFAEAMFTGIEKILTKNLKQDQATTKFPSSAN